jgi:hypothetical protein
MGTWLIAFIRVGRVNPHLVITILPRQKLQTTDTLVKVKERIDLPIAESPLPAKLCYFNKEIPLVWMLHNVASWESLATPL